MKSIQVSILISVSILFLDQVTKYIIKQTIELYDSITLIPILLQFTHVQNTGAGLSILQDHTLLLTIISATASLLILFYMIKEKEQHIKYALAIVLGGVIGNLIDRIIQKSVTDFIHIGMFPIFNIADCAIVLGISYLAYESIKITRKNKEKNQNSSKSSN